MVIARGQHPPEAEADAGTDEHARDRVTADHRGDIVRHAAEALLLQVTAAAFERVGDGAGRGAEHALRRVLADGAGDGAHAARDVFRGVLNLFGGRLGRGAGGVPRHLRHAGHTALVALAAALAAALATALAAALARLVLAPLVLVALMLVDLVLVAELLAALVGVTLVVRALTLVRVWLSHNDYPFAARVTTKFATGTPCANGIGIVRSVRPKYCGSKSRATWV